MAVTHEQLKEVLIGLDLVKGDTFDRVAKEARERNMPVERLLVDRGLVMDADLGRAIASELQLKFVDLTRERVSERTLHIIPELVAQHQQAIAYHEDDKAIYLGTPHVDNVEFFNHLEKKTGKEVVVAYATPVSVQSALTAYSSGIGKRVKDLVESLTKRPDAEQDVVKLVDTLLQYAHANRASDVHIEPFLDRISVRFRIDGVLHDILEIPRQLYDMILSRIKILARMRTDEHRAAQDGKLRFTPGASADQRAGQQRGPVSPFSKSYREARRGPAEVVDVRVSVVPVTEGENVVMRLLSAKSRRYSITDLGLSDNDMQKVRGALDNPHGMVLVTGPTGSGKTTTLYAMMQILNTRDIHISSIEDPVEYDIEGISQIQVNPKTNLTFAKGLRAIVRQDPDIIMVGEVRDEETAGIAVNSAMTGHLVLSSMHANDAATTFPRLFDMKVEPFLVASSVNVVVAQRLVRRICEHCRSSYTLGKDEIESLKAEPDLMSVVVAIGGNKDFLRLRFYRGAGCDNCGKTGYVGRTGIYEVMPMTDEIHSLIVKKAASDVITAKAREQGMNTMLEDGVLKVFKGETTLAEVLRVTKQ